MLAVTLRGGHSKYCGLNGLGEAIENERGVSVEGVLLVFHAQLLPAQRVLEEGSSQESLVQIGHELWGDVVLHRPQGRDRPQRTGQKGGLGQARHRPARFHIA